MDQNVNAYDILPGNCKEHLKSQYNFFGRIFVTVFFIDIQLYWICK